MLAVAAGLDRAGALKPPGGYLEALGAYSPALGPVGRLELGLRPWQDFRAYGFGEATRGDWRVGAGIRWTW